MLPVTPRCRSSRRPALPKGSLFGSPPWPIATDEVFKFCLALYDAAILYGPAVWRRAHRWLNSLWSVPPPLLPRGWSDSARFTAQRCIERAAVPVIDQVSRAAAATADRLQLSNQRFYSGVWPSNQQGRTRCSCSYPTPAPAPIRLLLLLLSGSCSCSYPAPAVNHQPAERSLPPNIRVQSCKHAAPIKIGAILGLSIFCSSSAMGARLSFFPHFESAVGNWPAVFGLCGSSDAFGGRGLGALKCCQVDWDISS